MMDFGSNSAVAKSPNFMDFRMLPANTTDKIKSVISPTDRFERLMNGSNWLVCRHNIEEVVMEIMIESKAYKDYILNEF